MLEKIIGWIKAITGNTQEMTIEVNKEEIQGLLKKLQETANKAYLARMEISRDRLEFALRLSKLNLILAQGMVASSELYWKKPGLIRNWRLARMRRTRDRIQDQITRLEEFIKQVNETLLKNKAMQAEAEKP